jgi:hypothetical protein
VRAASHPSGMLRDRPHNPHLPLLIEKILNKDDYSLMMVADCATIMVADCATIMVADCATIIARLRRAVNCGVEEVKAFYSDFVSC